MQKTALEWNTADEEEKVKRTDDSTVIRKEMHTQTQKIATYIKEYALSVDLCVIWWRRCMFHLQ